MCGRKPTIGVALLAVLGMLGTAATTTSSTLPSKNGRIVFRRYLDVAKRTSAIFTVNPDGTKVRRVTHPHRGVVDTEPDWSADGKLIAFERQVPCPAGGRRNGLQNTCDLVYTVKRDGKGLRSLVSCGFKAAAPFPGNCVGVDHPGWSPDGSKVAFQYNLADHRYTGSLTVNAGIWIVNANGTRAHEVTQQTPGHSWDFGPQWSPDGTRLAFFRRDLTTDSEAVYTVQIDGSSEFRVTPRTLGAANPNWSPDGTWILFSGEAVDGSSNIYEIHPDGTALTNLTKEGADGYHYLGPSFSPDGTQIATARTPGRGPERAADVVVMNADGSNIRPVTRTRLWDSGADWGRR